MPNITGCDLHVPHKEWSGNPQEARNYHELERWSLRLLLGYVTGAVTEPLHIPFKEWNEDAREAQNYYVIERWARDMQLDTTAILHIPNKQWADDQERQNYSEIERWALKVVTCLSTPGCVCNTLISRGGSPIIDSGDIGVAPDGSVLYVALSQTDVDIDIYTYPDLTPGVTVLSPEPVVAVTGGYRFGGPGGVFWLGHTAGSADWHLYFGNAAVLVTTITSDPTATLSLAASPSGKLYVFDTDNPTIPASGRLLEIDADLSTVTTVLSGINALESTTVFQPCVATDGAVWLMFNGIATGTSVAEWIRYDPATATSTSGSLGVTLPNITNGNNFLPGFSGNVVYSVGPAGPGAGFQIAPDGTISPYECMDNQGAYGTAGWSVNYGVIVWGGEHSGDYWAECPRPVGCG